MVWNNLKACAAFFTLPLIQSKYPNNNKFEEKEKYSSSKSANGQYQNIVNQIAYAIIL